MERTSISIVYTAAASIAVFISFGGKSKIANQQPVFIGKNLKITIYRLRFLVPIWTPVPGITSPSRQLPRDWWSPRHDDSSLRYWKEMALVVGLPFIDTTLAEQPSHPRGVTVHHSPVAD